MPAIHMKSLPLRWFASVLLVGIALTATAVSMVISHNQAELEQAVQVSAQRIAAEVVARIEHFQYGLRGVRGAVLTMGERDMTRERFHRYSVSRDLRAEFPGALGMGFVRRVPQSEEAAFVAAMRHDGMPDFSIRQIQAHDGERDVIQYLDPIDKNRAAIGFDIASEANRQRAAEEALLTGEIRLSGPIMLVQQTASSPQSFLLLMPAYRNGVTPASPAERKAAAFGWSFAALSMPDVLSSITLSENAFGLTFEDITDATQAVTFFQSKVPDSIPLTSPVATVSSVFGRTWRITLTAYAPLLGAVPQFSVAAVTLGGGALSLLLAALSLAWGLGWERNRQLFSARAHLAAIVESSQDAIIGMDLQGTVSSWNHGAQEMFGYSEAQVLGRRLVDLIVPAESAYEERDILAHVAAGQAFSSYNTERQRKDGSYFPVSVIVSPIRDDDGCIVGAAKTVRDITEQNAIETQIRDLNRTLELQVAQRTKELQRVVALQQAILNNAGYAIIATDPEGLITVFNPAAERLLGYSAAEMIGKCTPEILHDADELAAGAIEFSAELSVMVPVGFDVIVVKSLRKQANEHEWTYVRKDGGRLPVLLSATSLTTDDGVLIGFLCMAVDLSELKQTQISRKQLNDALAERSKDLERTGQIAGVGAWSVALASGKVSWSPQTYRLHEMPEEYQPTVELALQFYPPEAQERLQIVLNEAIKTSAPWDLELPFTSAGGRQLWVHVVGEVERDGQGRTVRLVGAIQDVTERHNAAHALEVARDRLLLAAEVAKMGVWIWTLGDNGLQWNERMFEFYDQPAELKQGGLNFEHWRSRIHPEDIEATLACLNATVAGSGVFDPIFRIVRRNGEVRHIQAGAFVEHNSAGRAWRVTGINLDVTDQVLLQSSLRHAKEQADAANRAKSEFLANMSHEIRTPMNAILGMLQLMQQTDLSQRQADYAGKAESAARALLGILNDILDFSRVEAGKLTLDPHPFSLDKLLRDIAVILSTSVGNKPVEVLFEIDAQIPGWIEGDALRLQQVLINLAGNAIKFTEQGEVVLTVKLSAQDEDGLALVFAIRDTGIGLTAEQCSNIFAGFSQAEASTARRYGGTGLGLAISQRLVGLMGGSLQVNSRLGQGSTFYFTMRCQPAANPGLPVVRNELVDMRNLHCLVVDDNASARDILANMLRHFGWHVDVADSGQTALEYVAQRSGAHPYDVIFIDWRMPELDGWETSERIRQMQQLEQSSLIVMVTAGSRELLAQKERQMPTLLDGFLIKPATASMLFDAVADSRAKRSLEKPLNTQAATIGPQRLKGLRILLVEDNLMNQQVARELLSCEGARVVVAGCGQDGIDAVVNATPPFDVVLMDIQMPDMDGYTATRTIRRHKGSDELPVIAVTANVMPSDREAAFAAGMNDHVGKPFDLSQLITVILRHTSTEAVPVASASTLVSMQTLNSQAATLHMGGNTHMYERALRGFIGALPAFVPDLDSAVKAGDNAAALHLLHVMGGVAATVGAEQLAADIALLEQDLKQARDAVFVGVLEPVRQAVAQVIEAALVLLDESESKTSQQ